MTNASHYSSKLCPIRAHAAEIVRALVFGATGETPEQAPPTCTGANCGFWKAGALKNINGEDISGRCGIADGGRP